MIKQFIEDAAKNFPIEWDRFTEKNGDFNIYGWIKRKDGSRDFVLFMIYIEDGGLKGNFCTSSAKYSRDLFKWFFGTTEGHNDCKLVELLT